MELQIELAGTRISIDFSGQAEEAFPLCNALFRGFFHQGQRSHARVGVSILENAGNSSLGRLNLRKPVFEQTVCTKDVAAWLGNIPGHENGFCINEKTICSFCLNGLLLFDPDTWAGRIYLLKKGPKRFMPLYRLFWIYFAQVLGERQRCFVHAAALVKDEKGYLFLGDSGAGKSTLSKTCRDCHVFSDDSPIFGKKDGEYHVFPSPFQQMDPLGASNEEVSGMSAQVKGLYFIKKDDRLYLEDMPKKKAISMIINRHIHFFSYLSIQARVAIFDLFHKACNNIPVCDLHFTQNGDGLQFVAST